MSLTSALSAGTSGLLAQSNAMAAISDNIANVNTVGYKRIDTQFNPSVKSDSTVNSYNAGGVQSASRQLVSESGQLEATQSNTDVGIVGDGFLVVTESTTPDATSAYRFTRAGSFSPDSEGNLRNAGGYYLQGWPVQADGSVDSDPSDLTELEVVNIAGVSGTAESTSRLSLNANLQSGADVRNEVTAGTYDPATANNMASYDALAGTGVEPNFDTSVEIFDSQGNLRTLNFAFLRTDPTATPNRWHVEAYITPADSVDQGAGLVDGQVATGTIEFNSDGTFDPDSPGTTFPTSITLGASADAAPAAGEVKWADELGVAGQTIAIDFGGPSSAGGLTQLASPSREDSSTVNGAQFGNLEDVDIQEDGMVVARFDNGVVREIYQVALATFANPNGLGQVEGAAFVRTADSGGFTLKQPGVAGSGELAPSRLESSTVDLGREFTSLIATQQAYSAASRVITTTDEMLSELVQIIR